MLELAVDFAHVIDRGYKTVLDLFLYNKPDNKPFVLSADDLLIARIGEAGQVALIDVVALENPLPGESYIEVVSLGVEDTAPANIRIHLAGVDTGELEANKTHQIDVARIDVNGEPFLLASGALTVRDTVQMPPSPP